MARALLKITKPLNNEAPNWEVIRGFEREAAVASLVAASQEDRADKKKRLVCGYQPPEFGE
jgi:hypothetical protein